MKRSKGSSNDQKLLLSQFDHQMEPRSYTKLMEYKLDPEHIATVNMISKKFNKYYFDLYTP